MERLLTVEEAAERLGTSARFIRRRRGNTVPLDAWGRPEDDQAVIVVASWRYLGCGYQSTGEAWLAASAAARAREERRIAKEELRTMTMSAAEQEQDRGVGQAVDRGGGC